MSTPIPSPTTPPNGELIFISYSHADRTVCGALHRTLEQAGFRVYRGEEQIRASEHWVTELENALQACAAFIVLVGVDGVRGWIGAEVQVALRRHYSPRDDALRLPIFPVLLEVSDAYNLPPFLGSFQVTRWPAGTEVPVALLEAIRLHKLHADAPLEAGSFTGCPFLGLNAFGKEHANLFFGRGSETLEAIAYLGDQAGHNPARLRGNATASYHRWLQIEGNSGAGKSSLVHAGILPLVELGALWAHTGFEHWTLLGPMLPGKDPVSNLARALARAAAVGDAEPDSMKELAQLEAHDKSLAMRLGDLSDRGRERSAMLLVIDQFEELFTFADEVARRRFDTLLAHALDDPESSLFVVSTVRADFLDRFDQLPQLQPLYNRLCKRMLLGVISPQGLRQAIEQPARLAGLDVSEVSAAILGEAKDELGALPLVENALFILWTGRNGNKLSGEQFQRENGIAGMLREQADALLGRIEAAFPGKGRHGALELLLRLTRINDAGQHSRQRVERAEAVLIAGGGDASMGERIVQMLAGERDPGVPGAAERSGALRLLTAHSENDVAYVDLIHETLVRARGRDEAGKAMGYRPALYDYIDANRDRELHRQQLRFSSSRWQARRGLGRWVQLAGWRERKLYKKLQVPAKSVEAAFLARSALGSGLVIGLAILVLGTLGEAFMWTRLRSLPLESMVTLERFRLGYAPMPTLVPIKPGVFDMGERDTAFLANIDKKFYANLGVPGVSGVALPKPFSLSTHEVTYDQYDLFIWSQHGAGGFAFPTTAKGGREDRPVVNVNRFEANAYAKWLGEQKKLECRLPTEAEWEYAARAGKKTAYPWGDEPGKNNANCRNCGSLWDNDQSAPVGSFKPNDFGLYDTSGNVWEWTCSAWNDTFDGSEQRCIEEKSNVARALRGGSWNNNTGFVRAGARNDNAVGNRNNNVGFRVLCSSHIKICSKSANAVLVGVFTREAGRSRLAGRSKSWIFMAQGGPVRTCCAIRGTPSGAYSNRDALQAAMPRGVPPG